MWENYELNSKDVLKLTLRDIDYMNAGYNEYHKAASSNGSAPERTLDKDKVKEAIRKRIKGK